MVWGHIMTEYCRVSEVLIVYCSGMQKCPPKPNTKKYNRLVREAVVRCSSVGASATYPAKVGETVEAGIIS